MGNSAPPPIQPAAAKQFQEPPEMPMAGVEPASAHVDLPEPEAEVEGCNELEIETYTFNEAPQKEVVHSKANAGIVTSTEDRHTCASCGRKFNLESFERHQRVCQKVFCSQRPAFDPMKGSMLASKPRRTSSGLSAGAHTPRCSPTMSRTPTAGCGALSPSGYHVQEGLRDSRQHISHRRSELGDNRTNSESGFENLRQKELRALQQLRKQMEEVQMMKKNCGEVQMMKKNCGEVPVKTQGTNGKRRERVANEIITEFLKIVQPIDQLDQESSQEAASETSEKHSEAALVNVDRDLDRSVRNTSPRYAAPQEQIVEKPLTQAVRVLSPATERSPRQPAPSQAKLDKHTDLPDRTIRPGSPRFPTPMKHRESAPAVPSFHSPSPCERPSRHSVAEPEMCGGTQDLKRCDNCGRRFNPKSFEKHRAVCQSVFGKPAREGQEAAPPQRSRASQARVERVPTSGAVGGVSPASNPVRVSSVTAPCSRATPSSDASKPVPDAPKPVILSDGGRQALWPCPHCGRSFRQGALETHAAVCQSVFPTHDTRSRARTPPRSQSPRFRCRDGERPNSRSVSPLPLDGLQNQSREHIELQAEPSKGSNTPLLQMWRSTSEHTIGSPTFSDRCRHHPIGWNVANPSTQGTPGNGWEGLHAGGPPRRMLSSPQRGLEQDPGSQTPPYALPAAGCADADIRAFCQERVTRLERARLNMKRGQVGENKADTASWTPRAWPMVQRSTSLEGVAPPRAAPMIVVSAQGIWFEN